MYKLYVKNRKKFQNNFNDFIDVGSLDIYIAYRLSNKAEMNSFELKFDTKRKNLKS